MNMIYARKKTGMMPSRTYKVKDLGFASKVW